jgi:hypothetical protein
MVIVYGRRQRRVSNRVCRFLFNSCNVIMLYFIVPVQSTSI